MKVQTGVAGTPSPRGLQSRVSKGRRHYFHDPTPLRANYCMYQPWITTSDCPGGAFDSKDAKKWAASGLPSIVAR